jgi:Na+-transporting NADH:ubiquinone oxidoreductase subunit F
MALILVLLERPSAFTEAAQPASSDLTFPSAIEYDAPMATNKFSGILEHKQLLTRDIIHLRIGLVEPRTIEFIAGQYLRLDSKPYGDKPAVSRTFSLASAPAQNKQVELIIRRNPDGICTPWIFDHLRKGESVTFNAPFGRFRLSDNLTPAMFIAGGSGMSALWGMLQDMIEKKLERKIRFFFSARTQADLYFIDILSRLEKEHAWFSFIPCLSGEPENSDWHGERGMINEIIRRRFSEAAPHEAYLCGPPGMVDACIQALTSLGMARDRIFFDAFIPQAS